MYISYNFTLYIHIKYNFLTKYLLYFTLLVLHIMQNITVGLFSVPVLPSAVSWLRNSTSFADIMERLRRRDGDGGSRSPRRLPPLRALRPTGRTLEPPP